ncbi:MAG: cobalt ECF transporter T component CbiQ [Clostridiaceae bacterium]
MISIDKLAYISNLRKVNPMEKFIFSVLTMIACIGLNNIAVSIIIIFLMGFLTIVKGKTPSKTYCGLILVPVVFLIIGVVTIAINVIGEGSDPVFGFTIFNINLGCTKESLITSAKIFFQALGSVSCLYFLTLSTPVFEILAVLRRLKIPKLFVELMGLIYRFIFILLEVANMIFISQSCRLGYSSIKLSYNSLGKLITSLFITSYKRSQDIYTSMESRCYVDEINLLEENYKTSLKNIVFIILLEAGLIIISKISGGNIS